MRNKNISVSAFASLFIFGLLLSIGCTNEANQNKETVEAPVSDTASAAKQEEAMKVKLNISMSISDIPFPFEILDTLYGKKIAFDDKVMNPLGNYSKYSQYNSKALNLGIYGADLSYAVSYEQFQQIGSYVKNTKKLSEDLNIDFAFNQDMMDKYNKNKNNKDSLIRIVFDSYQKVDNALKKDQRVGIAALVVAGSWLEGLYISSKTFSNAPKTDLNKSLYKTIGQQKISLNLVINLLSEFKSDAYISSLIKSLDELNTEFEGVTNSNVMDDKKLASLSAKVEKLRNKITQGS